MGFLLGLVPGLPSWAWRWIGIGLVLVAAVAFGWVKRGEHDQPKYDALQLAYSTFKADVEAKGVIAQREADKRVAAEKSAKEKADAENAKSIAALHNDVARMRRERDSARRSLVPAAASQASSPDRACFDRTKLESALRSYRDAVRGLVDEGSDAVIDLNTAKAWAQH